MYFRDGGYCVLAVGCGDDDLIQAGWQRGCGDGDLCIIERKGADGDALAVDECDGFVSGDGGLDGQFAGKGRRVCNQLFGKNKGLAGG